MQAVTLGCALALAGLACDDGRRGGEAQDGGARPDEHEPTPGVCDLTRCPQPETGLVCCTPDAQCGFDPLGLGLNCAPLPGNAIGDGVCELAECPLPGIGERCCTPTGRCGSDPFASGQICFANPPAINVGGDASSPDFAPTCDLASCPEPEAGLACCLPGGDCGVDMTGFGLCFPEPQASDAGQSAPPLGVPPDHPSITGDCPSYLGYYGPIWGCCSPYGVCGSFAAGQCLLPAGTPVPIPEPDQDAGASEPFLRCTPALE